MVRVYAYTWCQSFACRFACPGPLSTLLLAILARARARKRERERERERLALKRLAFITL